MKSTAGTFSKALAAHGSLPYPEYIVGTDPNDPLKILGSDGKWYIDTVFGLTAYIRGYNSNIAFYVAQCVEEYSGLTHNRPVELLEKASSLVTQVFCIDKIHPVRTGSDACLAAVTLARAVRPGKVVVIDGNYHGQWLQWKDPARGTMLDMDQFIVIDDDNYHEIQPDDVSCIIYEYPLETPSEDWWSFVRHMQRNGVLFIADEIITALRFKGNLACRPHVEPDLVVAGKSVANGFGFYFVGGTESLIGELEKQNPPFISTTYSADVAALAGTVSNLNSFFSTPFGAGVWRIGEYLFMYMRDEFFHEDGVVHIKGQPSRFVFEGDPDVMNTFKYYCLDQGLYVNRPVAPALAYAGREEKIANMLNEAYERTVQNPIEVEIPPRPLFTNR